MIRLQLQFFALPIAQYMVYNCLSEPSVYTEIETRYQNAGNNRMCVLSVVQLSFLQYC